MFYNLLKFCKKNNIKEELGLSSSVFNEFGVRRHLIRILKYTLSHNTHCSWLKGTESYSFPSNDNYKYNIITNGAGRIIGIHIKYHKTPHHFLTTKFTF